MAGAIVPVAINQVTEQRKGFQNITLTNWTNVAEPEINQGGRVEIEGALFSFTANEDLDASNNWAGFGNSTQIYGYYLVGGGGTTVVCELTTTAPTWQEESGGWYDTASDTNRFWGGIYKDGSGNYADKFIYLGRELAYSNNFNIDERGDLILASDITVGNDANVTGDIVLTGGITEHSVTYKTKIIDIGVWDMDTTSAIAVNHGLTFSKIRSVSACIVNNANTIKNQVPDGTDLIFSPGAAGTATVTQVKIARAGASIYDSVNYNGATNRGWITIIYEA